MKKIFNFRKNDELGKVIYVDSGQIIVEVTENNLLGKISIGNLVVIETTKKHEFTIGIISRVTRKYSDIIQSDDENEVEEFDTLMETSADYIKIDVIGTFKEVYGEEKNIFRRGIDVFPHLDANCYSLSGVNLQNFMNILNTNSNIKTKLKLGKFMMDVNAESILDGNKFFQRHAAILGSTGSGKSWCVANILEKANELQHPNIIVFDMHGEYSSLCAKGGIASRYKIAGSGDLFNPDENILFLPYWLLNREEMLSMLLDRSDNNAPNQASKLIHYIRELKKETLVKEKRVEVMETFTVDSPIQYNIEELINFLRKDDIEMKPGKNALVKGEWNGKLTRLISRLEAKISDKTHGFMFLPPEDSYKYEWLSEQMFKLIGCNSNGKGIKIIDFSEVPSDILPIVTGTMARLLYNVQFWMKSEEQTPFTLICDEAHLYLPTRDDADIVQKQALYNFERIAKEGRKHGVSLLVVSQRPADVSKTILSQCNNFIVLRLTNERDKSVIKNLMPDSLRGTLDSISLLDVGESLVIGDSILLPSRIILDKPEIKPLSATRDFWNEWEKKEPKNSAILEAVESMRKQSRNN